MELTVQEISHLLEVAVQSSLTAEEIGQLILRHKAQLFVVSESVSKSKKLTVRELFSRESIGQFTDVGPLITRIENAVFLYPGVVEPRNFDRSVDEIDFPPLRKWKNCGKKCQEIVYKLLRSQDMFPQR